MIKVKLGAGLADGYSVTAVKKALLNFVGYTSPPNGIVWSGGYSTLPETGLPIIVGWHERGELTDAILNAIASIPNRAMYIFGNEPNIPLWWGGNRVEGALTPSQYIDRLIPTIEKTLKIYTTRDVPKFILSAGAGTPDVGTYLAETIACLKIRAPGYLQNAISGIGVHLYPDGTRDARELVRYVRGMNDIIVEADLDWKVCVTEFGLATDYRWTDDTGSAYLDKLFEILLNCQQRGDLQFLDRIAWFPFNCGSPSKMWDGYLPLAMGDVLTKVGQSVRKFQQAKGQML